MRNKKPYLIVTAILLSAVIASCNIGKSAPPTPDVGAIYTSAAGTMIAQVGDQQTQTAQAAPAQDLSSPTPFATNTDIVPTFAIGGAVPTLGTPFTLDTPVGGITPLATLPSSGGLVGGMAVGCSNATFIGETIPDKTVVEPGKKFKKAWMLQNSGTCTWDQGFSFAFKSGDRLNGEDVKILQKTDFTDPGHSQTFVVPMWAPGTAGEYIGYWQMKNDAGQWFGSLVSVDIVAHR